MTIKISINQLESASELSPIYSMYLLCDPLYCIYTGKKIAVSKPNARVYDCTLYVLNEQRSEKR